WHAGPTRTRVRRATLRVGGPSITARGSPDRSCGVARFGAGHSTSYPRSLSEYASAARRGLHRRRRLLVLSPKPLLRTAVLCLECLLSSRGLGMGRSTRHRLKHL